MRFADYFGRSQFPWMKILKESLVAKMVNVPLSNMSEDVYKTSTDWLNRRSGLPEFPDEVDTPFDTPARKRFAKYRGLKSFRTSSWDPKESLPAEYARIFAFDNFSRTQKHVLAKAQEMEQGTEDEIMPPGS